MFLTKSHLCKSNATVTTTVVGRLYEAHRKKRTVVPDAAQCSRQQEDELVGSGVDVDFRFISITWTIPARWRDRTSGVTDYC